MNENEKSLTYFVANPTQGPPGLSTPEFRVRYTVENLSPAERDQVETACHSLGCTVEEYVLANVAVGREREAELRQKLQAHERGEITVRSLDSYMENLVADRIRADQAAKLPLIGERPSPDEDA